MATTYALDKKPVHEADENASDANHDAKRASKAANNAPSYPLMGHYYPLMAIIFLHSLK